MKDVGNHCQATLVCLCAFVYSFKWSLLSGRRTLLLNKGAMNL